MTDQSPPVSRAFTSRLREVLTARLPQDPRWVVWVDGVVEELADVTPAQGIDRDALRRTLERHEPEMGHREAYCLCGEPIGDWACRWHDHLTNVILALVRPVEGVVLSPEEARRALSWYATAKGLSGADVRVSGVIAAGLEALS